VHRNLRYCKKYAAQIHRSKRHVILSTEIYVFHIFIHFFQAHFRQVTGNNLVLLFKCRCITAIVLSLALSHVSTLASYDLRNFAIEKMPEALLYTYLSALRYLTAFYWYFSFAALSRSADLLEQSLSKVSEDSSILSETLIRNDLL
jgi:hypothetical protein